jgi:hypothetical protein
MTLSDAAAIVAFAGATAPPAVPGGDLLPMRAAYPQLTAKAGADVDGHPMPSLDSSLEPGAGSGDRRALWN